MCAHVQVNLSRSKEKPILFQKEMSSNSSASLQHILISIEEYDRLKNIEKLYQKLHKGIEDKFQIKSEFYLNIRYYSQLFA